MGGLNNLFNYSNKFYKFDQIWFEKFGMEEVYWDMNKIRSILYSLNVRGRIKYILLIFILLLYFIIFYSYSLI